MINVLLKLFCSYNLSLNVYKMYWKVYNKTIKAYLFSFSRIESKENLPFTLH